MRVVWLRQSGQARAGGATVAMRFYLYRGSNRVGFTRYCPAEVRENRVRVKCLLGESSDRNDVVVGFTPSPQVVLSCYDPMYVYDFRCIC